KALERFHWYRHQCCVPEHLQMETAIAAFTKMIRRSLERRLWVAIPTPEIRVTVAPSANTTTLPNADNPSPASQSPRRGDVDGFPADVARVRRHRRLLGALSGPGVCQPHPCVLQPRSCPLESTPGSEPCSSPHMRCALCATAVCGGSARRRGPSVRS